MPTQKVSSPSARKKKTRAKARPKKTPAKARPKKTPAKKKTAKKKTAKKKTAKKKTAKKKTAKKKTPKKTRAKARPKKTPAKARPKKKTAKKKTAKKKTAKKKTAKKKAAKKSATKVQAKKAAKKKPAAKVSVKKNAPNKPLPIIDEHGFPENAHYTVPPKEERFFNILEVPEEYRWHQHKHLPKAVLRHDYAVIPCTHCGAHCCTAAIRLTVVEALRISYTLCVPFDSMFLPGPLQDSWGFESYPVAFELDDGPVRLRMKKDDEGMCVNWFSPSPGQGRCGIWAMRPAVCRIYPFVVEIDELKIKVGDQSICPTRWLQNDETRKNTEYDMRRMLADRAEEEHYITQWNSVEREDRSWTAFLAWIDAEMAPALGYDPESLKKIERRRLGKRLW